MFQIVSLIAVTYKIKVSINGNINLRYKKQVGLHLWNISQLRSCNGQLENVLSHDHVSNINSLSKSCENINRHIT